MTETVVEKSKEEKATEWANVQAFYDLVRDNYDFYDAYRLLTEDEADAVLTNTHEERRQYESMYNQDDDDDRRDY